MANRVTTWSAGNTLTAAALNGEFNNIYTGTIDRTAGRWGSNDDIQLTFGSSQDAAIEWDTAQTVDTLMVGVDATSKSICIVDKADMSTDMGHSAMSEPTLFIHPSTTPASAYLAISVDDSTNYAHFDSKGGDGFKFFRDGTISLFLDTSSLKLTTNPALFIVASPTSTNYGTYLRDTSDTIGRLYKLSDSGVTSLQIDVGDAAGGSAWSVDFQKNTNVNQTFSLNIYEPDNGTTIDHTLKTNQSGAASELCRTAASVLYIGANSSASGAKLAVVSTTLGFKLPVMSTAQKNAISSPDDGVMVYDTGLAKVCIRAGGAWETITSS